MRQATVTVRTTTTTSDVIDGYMHSGPRSGRPFDTGFHGLGLHNQTASCSPRSIRWLDVPANVTQNNQGCSRIGSKLASRAKSSWVKGDPTRPDPNLARVSNAPDPNRPDRTRPDPRNMKKKILTRPAGRIMTVKDRCISPDISFTEN